MINKNNATQVAPTAWPDWTFQEIAEELSFGLGV